MYKLFVVSVTLKSGKHVRHQACCFTEIITISILIQRQCRITYSATENTGFYGVAAMIEDFASPTDTQPLSSIPLQFLVYVFNSNEACDERPEFAGYTRAKGSCIGIPPGGTYFDRIIVRAGGPSKRCCLVADK